jgi:hypothetical protein
MSKRTLLIIISLLFSCLSYFGSVSNVQAACTYPLYCDAAPGTCATTCNGGLSCELGNTVCVAPSTSSCRCNGGPLDGNSCSSPGYACSTDAYGATTSLCECDYVHSCGCTNTTQESCCNGSGGTCGWGAYSACSAPCGGGTQTRTNTCNGNFESQPCNTQTCPAPSPSPGAPSPEPPVCYWNPWSACDGGTCTRSRTDSCGGTPQTEACTDHPACTPPGCTTEAWSTCSATCGIGTRSRYNSCVSGGVETQVCDTCNLNGCSCTVACGQSTACGTCSNADFGQPGPITLTPSSGNLQMPVNRSITLSWTAAAKAENYDIEVYPVGTTAGLECTAANTFCATGITGTSYTFTAPLGIAHFNWRVKPNNNTCNAATGFISATASDSWTVAEGAPYAQTPEKAVDGQSNTIWNAGSLPPHWIELDLSKARTVTGVQMTVARTTSGNETIQIYAGATPNPTTLVYSATLFSDPMDVLNVVFSSPSTNTRYIRIVTTAKDTWAAWTELVPTYSDGIGSWTNGTFTLVGPISGNIYLDQGASATTDLDGKCVAGPLPGQNPGAVSTIEANYLFGGTTAGSFLGSAYSIQNIPNYGEVGLTLAPDTTLWRCTCPNNCVYAEGPSGFDLHETADFYIANVAQPWWQTQNGLIYAGNRTGNALVSLIPPTCVGPSCQDRLALRNSVSSSESSGIVITGGGDIDTDTETSLKYSKVRQETAQARVIGSTYNGPRENYQYFYNLYSMGSAPTADFNGTKPTAAPTNGRAYFANGNTTVNIGGGGWTVNTGESYVIFVNGNLTIDGSPDDRLTVAEGGFLAFIVSGNVTVTNTVGRADYNDTTSSVHGVYIADRIIIQGGRAGGDLRFNGEGTFVGWTGITLGRYYGTLSISDTVPSESFKFRPDFVINVPERMTRPLYTWQETN